MSANILTDSQNVALAMHAVMQREQTSQGLSITGCDEINALVRKLDDINSANAAAGINPVAVAVATPATDPLLVVDPIVANDPNTTISGVINAN